MKSLSSDDFIILNKTLLFISEVDNLISDSYILLEYIFRTNYSVNKDIRDSCLSEILVRLSIIDKLLERFYKKKYISEKQLYTSVRLLTEVNRMVKKWLG